MPYHSLIVSGLKQLPKGEPRDGGPWICPMNFDNIGGVRSCYGFRGLECTPINNEGIKITGMYVPAHPLCSYNFSSWLHGIPGTGIIPSQIGSLNRLITLSIGLSQITSLATQIGKLTLLQYLYSHLVMIFVIFLDPFIQPV